MNKRDFHRSLAANIALGMYPSCIVHIDRPNVAPSDAAMRVAEEAVRMVLAYRATAVSLPMRMPTSMRNLIAIVKCENNYRQCFHLSAGNVICAAIHGGSPLRDEERWTFAKTVRWLAHHVGVRSCVVARRVGRHDRFVFVGKDRTITVLRLPVPPKGTP